MKIRYADNFISATVAAISSPYTTASLDTGEVDRLLAALTVTDWSSVNEEIFAVPVSLLDSAGDPITSSGRAVVGHIVGWDTGGANPDDVMLYWSNPPTSTVASGAQLACRLTARAMDALPQPRLHHEGFPEASSSYLVRPGSFSYVSVAANSINIQVDGDGSFSPTISAPAVMMIDNSGAFTGVTVSANVHAWGTLRWRDGVAPAFTGGAELMLVRLRWIDDTSAIGEFELYE